MVCHVVCHVQNTCYIKWHVGQGEIPCYALGEAGAKVRAIGSYPMSAAIVSTEAISCNYYRLSPALTLLGPSTSIDHTPGLSPSNGVHATWSH